MTILRTNTIAGVGTTTFGPLLDGNLEFNSQNYVVLPKGTSTQEGVLRTTADVVGTGGTFYDNLVLAMPFNAATGLTDVSSRNRNPAAYGNVAISTAQSKFYGSSAYFDGSGDYLSLANSNDFNFGVGEYTIEFWLRTGTDAGWLIFNAANDTGLRMCVGNNGTSGANPGTIEVDEQVSNADYYIRSTSRVDNNTWNHVAVVRQNGQGTKIYINGTNEATGATGRNFDNTNSFFIGTRSSLTAFYNGYLQDLRIYKGLAKYTANFTPPDRIAELGVGFKAGQLRYNTDSNKVELYDGSQWTEVQASRPDLNGGARGVFGGGTTPTIVNTIDYITISSTGNASDFGDLLTSRHTLSSCSSNTRGIFGGGVTSSNTNVIEFITISSTGDAADFGDLTVARPTQGCSSSTRGIFAGGYVVPVGPTLNTIDYITIASTGNAQDFGDLTTVRLWVGACASPTRGIFGGGQPSVSNVIDFITIGTLGNATDFGDLSQIRGQAAGCSNATRGLFGGGQTPTNVNTIDFITIATIGNAVKFGDLTQTRQGNAACSSSTRGVWGNGATPTIVNTIDYVAILTQGNAVDFGDLTVARTAAAACSNAHGGL